MTVHATPRSTRPYFPMLLANGRDAVLIDYSGSMMTGSPEHAHHEQNQGVLGGWYKIAHRVKKDKCIIPIVQSGYHLICNGEHYDPDDYNQSFDSIAAILTTRISASGFKLDIETFLSDDSVLTEHYKVVDAPDGYNELEFFIAAPHHGLYPLVLPTKPEIKMEANRSSGLIKYDYKIRGIKGCGYLWSDRSPNRVSGSSIVFTDIKRGFKVTKNIIMLDETDQRSYKQAGRVLIKTHQTTSYKRYRSNHAKIWGKFADKSMVTVPDQNLQYLYDLGIYTLKAHQHPSTGCTTVGMFPPLWGGGGIFGYDSYYLQQAMLRTNHTKESGKLLGFWRLCSKQARIFAKDIGKPGTFFPWWSFTPLGASNGGNKKNRLFEKRFDTCVVALEVFRHYESTGDATELVANWSLVKGCLDFLLSESVVEFDDEAIIKNAQGANESIAVSNDTLTAVVIAKVLDMAISVGLKVPKRYGVILRKLRAGLAKNYSDGVLMPFRGAEQPGILPVMVGTWNLPECIDYKSIRASLNQSKTEWGLCAGMPTQKYRDWPWFHFRAAITLAFLGKEKVFLELLAGTKYNSALGAFPEKIRIDGYSIAYWYSAVHALFVFAMNCFLVNEAENRINIFRHLPKKWRDVEFKKLRLPPGLLVSARLEKGKLASVKIKNDTKKPIETTVSVPSRLLSGSSRSGYKFFPVRILSGQNKNLI